jgi:hypothetical protein
VRAVPHNPARDVRLLPEMGTIRIFKWSKTMVEDHRKTDLWLEGAASAVNLEIPPAYRDEVRSQLELNRSLIAPLLDFELPAPDRDN